MGGRGRIGAAAFALIILGVAEAAYAQQQGDVISTSGGDRFAVGNARKWYDAHSDEVKTRGSGCLSILAEAKVYEDKALALYAAGRRAKGREASELVRQANDQITLRTKALERFKDCVNQAIRSDQIATSGGKNITRTKPNASPTPRPTFGPPPKDTLNTIVDDCFREKDPLYRPPNWSRHFTPQELRAKTNGSAFNAFDVAAVAAEQALEIDERAYGRWSDRELMTDYLIGWLTHCITNRGYLPLRDARGAYARRMDDASPGPINAARAKERDDAFRFGYGTEVLPPFWDRPDSIPDKERPKISRQAK